MSETTALHTELLTIGEARELAGRRAQGHSLTLADRERLFAWVRDRADAWVAAGATRGLSLAKDADRHIVALHLALDLGLDRADDLLRAAGWPS